MCCSELKSVHSSCNKGSYQCKTPSYSHSKKCNFKLSPANCFALRLKLVCITAHTRYHFIVPYHTGAQRTGAHTYPCLFIGFSVFMVTRSTAHINARINRLLIAGFVFCSLTPYATPFLDATATPPPSVHLPTVPPVWRAASTEAVFEHE
jgi:hypothetical protein